MPDSLGGKTLRVDLTEKEFEIEPSENYNDDFLGGKGVSAKILWDEVKPETKPFDPENRIVFANGILTGTLAPSACKCSVSTKSPVTGIFGDSNIGGFWPVELKFAGYDNLIIYGCSDNPTYLFINDEKVELRDANHLWGKDTYETTKILTEEIYRETGDPDSKVLCIGPAGENKVFAAAITCTLVNSASRCGIGAVMGSKNLKAIVVRGTGDITVAKPKELKELCSDLMVKAVPLREGLHGIYGELKFLTHGCVFGSIDETPPPAYANPEELEKICKDFCDTYRRETACFNCCASCQSYLEIPGYPNVMLHCEPWFNFGLRLKTIDFAWSAQLLLKCQKLGINAFAVSADAAFLMDLYEKGIISEKDTDGIPMKWGNKEAMDLMAEKIARKEGCGELFAEGIVKAAQKIGRGAEQYAYHTKGMELYNYSFYMIDQALCGATSQTGDPWRASGATPIFFTVTNPQIVDFITKELPKDVAEEAVTDPFVGEYKGKARFVEYYERTNSLADLVGVCRYYVRYVPNGILPPPVMALLVSYTTGKEMDEDALNLYNERVETLIRAFNLREGLRRKDDTVPKLYFEEVSPRFGFKLDREKFDQSLTEYYKLHGWDENGFPTKGRLSDLNLKYVADELETRGLL